MKVSAKSCAIIEEWINSKTKKNRGFELVVFMDGPPNVIVYWNV